MAHERPRWSLDLCRKDSQMKYLYTPFLFFITGCELHFGRQRSPNAPGKYETVPQPPQPEIVDPIDLIIDGNNTKELTEQSHITPFMTIVVVVLLVCLLPLLYTRSKPYITQAVHHFKKKLDQITAWIKKKFDRKKK